MTTNPTEPPSPLSLRPLFVVPITLAAILSASSFLFSRIVIEKLLTALAMPYGLVWMGVGFLALIAYTLRNQLATRLLVICWIAIYIAGSSILGKHGLLYLESDYLEYPFETKTTFDVVVVLGGGADLRPNRTPQLNLSGDRVMTAARMFFEGSTQSIVCTGSRVKELDRRGFDQSKAAKDILVDVGVPEEVIKTTGGRNTSEEMRTLVEMFTQNERVGLITSAWHMPRALRLAKSQGFEPVPIPSDFMTPPITTPTIVDFVPSGEGAFYMQLFAKECLAGFVGR